MLHKVTRYELDRRQFLRRASLAAVGLGAARVLAACGEDASGTDTAGAAGSEPASDAATTTSSAAGISESALLDTARERGFVNIGISDGPPASLLDDDGRASGWAPEAARAIFQELGVPDVQGILVDWGSLIPGLLSERFDVIAASMWIRPERCQEVIFSDPLECSLEALGVAVGNPLGLNTYGDFLGKPEARLGVISGTAAEAVVADLGIPEGQITVFQSLTDAFDAREADRIDAFGYDDITVGYLVSEGTYENIEMATPFTPVVDGVPQTGCSGMAFRPADQALRAMVNEQIALLRDSGALVPIAAEWGVSEGNLAEAANHTTDELCNR
jgi:polar amino acid transport system substrate-binding protein